MLIISTYVITWTPWSTSTGRRGCPRQVKLCILFQGKDSTPKKSWSPLIRPWRPETRGSSSRLAPTWFSPARQRRWTHRCQSTALAAQCPACHVSTETYHPSAPLHHHSPENMNTDFRTKCGFSHVWDTTEGKASGFWTNDDNVFFGRCDRIIREWSKLKRSLYCAVHHMMDQRSKT